MRSYLQGIRHGHRKPDHEPGKLPATSELPSMQHSDFQDLSEPATYQSNAMGPGFTVAHANGLLPASYQHHALSNREERIKLTPKSTYWSSGDTQYPQAQKTATHISSLRKSSYEGRRNVTKDFVQSAPSMVAIKDAGPPRLRTRLIDTRFEEMRAHQNQPFKQSIHHQNAVAQNITSGLFVPHVNTTSPTYNGTSLDVRSHPQREKEGQSEQKTAQEPELHVSGQSRAQGKIKRLNPKTLLAQRKSNKNMRATYIEHANVPAPQIPSDFEPSIRGKLVHDFSAPRQRPGKPRNEHVTEALASQRLERDLGKNQGSHLVSEPNPGVGNSLILQQTTLSEQSPITPNRSTNSPASVARVPERAEMRESSKDKDVAKSLISVMSIESNDDPSALHFPKKMSLLSLHIPSSPKVHSYSMDDQQSIKRHKSNSSRFSFDLAGVGSAAQEKLLEDKHRMHAQRKLTSATEVSRDSIYSNIDDMCQDFDDLDDEFEERIPGINCDEDDVLPATSSTYQPVAPSASTGDCDLNHCSPPLDSLSDPVSPISTEITSAQNNLGEGSVSGESSEQLQDFPFREAGMDKTVHDVGFSLSSRLLPAEIQHSPFNIDKFPASFVTPMDDFYFDDGMIEDDDLVAEPQNTFDENIFDDNSTGIYGRPLRDRNVGSVVDAKDLVRRLDKEGPHVQNRYENVDSLHEDDAVQHAETANGSHEQTVTIQKTMENFPEEKNNAVHGANAGDLASALELVILNDKMLHGANQGHRIENSSSFFSELDTNTSPYLEKFDDFDEDDAIVAAANAEALENDDDGFYGSEFGFFARDPTKNQTNEGVHGGYFGDRDEGTANPFHCGNGDFIEPSLTPITERSEWSNRNSSVFTSMHMSANVWHFPGSGQSDDVNSQLALLKQFRRGAFGGSEMSLPNMSNRSSPRSGSPVMSSQVHARSHSHGGPGNLSSLSTLPHNMSSLSLQQMRENEQSASSSPENEGRKILLPSLPTMKGAHHHKSSSLSIVTDSHQAIETE